MRPPTGGEVLDLVRVPLVAKPDQIGHHLVERLFSQALEREANQGRVADPECAFTPSVCQHAVEPPCVVHEHDHAHTTLVRAGLRVTDSCHAGILTAGGDKLETLDCLAIGA